MIKIKLAGIYLIQHIPSGHFYIGLSKDIFSRWSSHYTNIKIKKHTSPLFIELFNKTHITDWKYTILHQLSKTELGSTTGLKGVKLDKLLNTTLLKLEKEYMNKYPKKFALNKDNKHFY